MFFQPVDYESDDERARDITEDEAARSTDEFMKAAREVCEYGNAERAEQNEHEHRRRAALEVQQTCGYINAERTERKRYGTDIDCERAEYADECREQRYVYYCFGCVFHLSFRVTSPAENLILLPSLSRISEQSSSRATAFAVYEPLTTTSRPSMNRRLR